MIGNNGQSLRLLLGAVGFVLLIACTNVSSLAVARGAARRSEIAVRAALGAVPARLARGLLIEHLILATFAGAIGVGLAVAGVQTARALAPASLPRRDDIAVDWRVLMFALIATILTGLLVGALPAIAGARTQLSDVMKAGGRASTSGPSSRRARSALIAIELALSVVLLAGAGLVARSFWSLQQVSLGFEPDHVALAELTVSLPNDRTRGKYVQGEPRALFFDQILQRLATIPGVEKVGASRTVPLRDASLDTPISVDGRPPLAPTDLPRASFRAASADYFATMQMPILRGRGFTPSDRAGAPPVAVISETMAQRLFGKADPIGQRIKRGPVGSPAPWMTVVGVLRDARLTSIDAPPTSELYVPMLQSPPVTMAVVLRTRQDPATLGPVVVKTVREIDPDQPVYHTQTMNDVVSASVGQRRFAALLLVVFAVFSLGLAAVGVYGLVAQSVVQRRRELGLRWRSVRARGRCSRWWCANHWCSRWRGSLSGWGWRCCSRASSRASSSTSRPTIRWCSAWSDQRCCSWWRRRAICRRAGLEDGSGDCLAAGVSLTFAARQIGIAIRTVEQRQTQNALTAAGAGGSEGRRSLPVDPTAIAPEPFEKGNSPGTLMVMAARGSSQQIWLVARRRQICERRLLRPSEPPASAAVSAFCVCL